MITSFVKKELLGFFGAVMSCFFDCFGLRRGSQNLVAKTPLSRTREPFLSGNQLSSLLQAEEEKEDSGFNTPEQISESKLLKDEARFLKACGTIPQTPVEIRKASERYEDVSHENEGSEPFRFHSWLPDTSIEKLNMEKQLDQPPTPIKFSERLVNGEGPFKHTPSSGSQVNGSGSTTDETSSMRTPYTAVAPSEQCRNRSVRFKCKDDVALFSSTSSSSDTDTLYSKRCASGGLHSVSKYSPYPTPLKLTDEMQTPGTVFPANFSGVADGKNPRIRAQYVYSALNPVENISQMKLLEEDEVLFENGERVDQQAEVKKREASGERGEATLSAWLKPPHINQEGKKNLGQTPGDRPIIGLVAAHWNQEEETPRISPKYWDGNGIPNSTHKYKEDQKVRWHATPFEERLEKALSEDSPINLRKDTSPASSIDFDDNKENDTALSQRQPSSYSNQMLSV